MNNRKIRKVSFISPELKAIYTDKEIYICDQKDNIVKTFDRQNSDLYVVKNSHYLAYVRHRPLEPRDPGARRDAVVAFHHTLQGSTTLYDLEQNLKELDEIPHPLMYPVSLSEGQFIGGICGRIASVYDRTSSHLFTQNHLCLNEDTFFLNDKHFGVRGQNGYFYLYYLRGEENLLWCSYKNFSVYGICPLKNDRFFLHFREENKPKSAIYQYEGDGPPKFNVKCEIEYSTLIQFKTLLLLSDEMTILGQSERNIFYLIDTNSLSITEIPLKLKSTIVQIVLTKDRELIGVTSDGRYLDLDPYILEYSQTRAILHRDTTYPTDPISLIVGYEKNYHRFFEFVSPVREILDCANILSQDLTPIISGYEGRFLKFSGNKVDLEQQETGADNIKRIRTCGPYQK